MNIFPHNHNWRHEWAGGDDFLYVCSGCGATIVNTQPGSEEAESQLAAQKNPIVIEGGE